MEEFLYNRVQGEINPIFAYISHGLKYITVLLLFIQSFLCNAQEFFPAFGPASNLPKEVLGVKLSNEFYNDASQLRLWQGYIFSYGISSKIEIGQTYSFSNHHGYYLPQDFIFYDNTIHGLRTNGYINGGVYPFTLENFSINIKYRFLNIDGQNEHFRMAWYLQLAAGNEPHEVAELSLLGDNSGASAGLITTYLKNRFAISLTLGALIPHEYIQSDSNIVMHYGNAINYGLSFGYLLLPRKYKDYKQTNVNLYMEFVGETYQGMQSITKEGENVKWTNVPSLNSGSYLEARPSIQFIFLSNTRLDFSIAYLLAGQSYERSYPLYFINVQHNFYL
ncbi:MAG TPA: hypothetical protein VK806_06335 [Bacteroidia bacterium]|jgi:hypothetical protein|nr:hypothetical protein [Bacteroidia bacterium]